MVSLATFRVEVTPPIGYPLGAGGYGLAEGVTDPLFAGGVILRGGSTPPIVLCAIDWCEISNRSHLAWRAALAEAARTSPARVAVHCLHAHCTPWPDEGAQQLLDDAGAPPLIMDVAWCRSTQERVAAAVRAAQSTFQPVTHLEWGKGQVEKVASNRRILGTDGKIKAVRWTRTYDPAVRAEPEGVIDPFLKTLSFWNEKQKLAALHYYAVHPTSYEDSFVTPDFTGLARERRMSEDDGVLHLFFNECAGNITAGKYNDGAKENREIFTQRIYQAIRAAEAPTRRVPVTNFEWKTTPVHLPPREDLNEDELQAVMRDDALPDAKRSIAAIKLAYLKRQDTPIEISALHLGDEVCIIHLPGEAFIEYQLFAQRQRPEAFVAVPSYGDCGPGYICLEKSFAEGGYEPTDSFVAGRSEAILKSAIAHVSEGR